MFLNLIAALLLSVPAADASQSQQLTGCNPAAEVADVQFDSALISPPPIDSASVEATLLSGMDYQMLPTHGHLVRFIVYDDRLPNGKETFAFNVRTFDLILAQETASQQAQFTLAIAYENSGVRIQQAGSGGCRYEFVGQTRCSSHTWYGLYCLTGSWYCYLFNSGCIWFAIGSCN